MPGFFFVCINISFEFFEWFNFVKICLDFFSLYSNTCSIVWIFSLLNVFTLHQYGIYKHHCRSSVYTVYSRTICTCQDNGQKLLYKITRPHILICVWMDLCLTAAEAGSHGQITIKLVWTVPHGHLWMFFTLQCQSLTQSITSLWSNGRNVKTLMNSKMTLMLILKLHESFLTLYSLKEKWFIIALSISLTQKSRILLRVSS